MKPRPLGNKQKELRDLSLMKLSDTLRTMKDGIREKRDPYLTMTEIALNVVETIDLLKRMETSTEETSQ